MRLMLMCPEMESMTRTVMSCKMLVMATRRQLTTAPYTQRSSQRPRRKKNTRTLFN